MLGDYNVFFAKITLLKSTLCSRCSWIFYQWYYNLLGGVPTLMYHVFHPFISLWHIDINCYIWRLHMYYVCIMCKYTVYVCYVCILCMICIISCICVLYKSICLSIHPCMCTLCVYSVFMVGMYLCIFIVYLLCIPCICILSKLVFTYPSLHLSTHPHYILCRYTV